LAPLEREIGEWPGAAQEVAREGVRRLAAYQDFAYAGAYVERLRPIRALDDERRENGRLLKEVARHLAVRMSYEDVIRVAQAKCDPQRFARIAAEKGIAADEPYAVIDYLKPGVEEICSVLPPRLAEFVLRLAERRGWSARLHLGMEVESTSILGFLRFWTLAKLRRFRRGTYRYRQEQAAIDNWLSLIEGGAALSADLALEIAECARLIKGYGETHKRGSANFAAIEARLIRPALAGRLPAPQAIDAVASARVAALADPDGESLSRALGEAERRVSFAVAAE
jgi:indolepyruvate ferredoxin oxidoreductase beta subunit